jgi:hypothetical protein
MTKLICAAAAGFLLASGLLLLFWTWAPYPLTDGPTYEALLEEVLSEELKQSPSEQSAIYIQPDLKPVITRLQKRFPKWQLLPLNQRPDAYGCSSNIPCGTPFLSVDCATFPLWRTALVSVTSPNAGSQLLLIEIGNRWRLVSRKGFVI